MCKLKRDFRRRNRWYNEWVHTADLELKNGDRETIIQWLYDSNLVQWYVTFILEAPLTNGLVEEAIGECWLHICEVKQERWDDLYSQGKFAVSGYVTGIIKQQLVSTHSAFFNKIAKRAEREKIKDEKFWINYEEEH